MAKRGRPGIYSPEIAAEICERMAMGESLRSICRAEGMPAEVTVRGWAIEDREGFLAQYAMASQTRMDCLADEILEIADNASSEDVQAARLRIDTRKWLMSKIAPKRLGDKLDLTHADPDGMTVKFITVYEAKKDKP
jgi:hypothetical protein